jgi:hypothetical protein
MNVIVVGQVYRDVTFIVSKTPVADPSGPAV